MSARGAGLTVEHRSIPGACRLRLSGSIDDQFSSELFGELARVTLLDLRRIVEVTSGGLAQWTAFLETSRRAQRSTYLVQCSRAIVDQLNLVVNFAGPGEVLSVVAPYHCAPCASEREVIIDLRGAGSLLRSGGIPRESCTTCGARLTFEDRTYFRFAGRLGAPQLAPSTLAMLPALGVTLREPSTKGGRSLEVSKLIEAEITLIKLAGAVDESFPTRRLLAGVEGEVVLLLSELTGVSATGAARWTEFFERLGAQASAVILAEVPQAIAEQIDRRKLDVGQAIVHSIFAPCYCRKCDELVQPLVPLTKLIDGKGGIATCARRGHPVELIEGAMPIERLLRETRTASPAARAAIDRARDLFSSADVEARMSADSEASVQAVSRRRVIGEYELVRPLSEGGMSQIYLAKRASLGGFAKPVALKLFRRELLEVSRGMVQMFLQEARLTANLNHRNIIQLFDVGEDSGYLYVAMEYIDGLDLHRLHERVAAPLPLWLAARIGVKIAEALDYAHTARDINGKPLDIVHRDVSMRNIVLGFDGQTKLIDFGIAVTRAAALEQSSSDFAGNLGYMSPEQWLGQPVDGRSDIFSLGVVLHELLSGGRLYRRETTEAIREAVLKAPAPSLANVPPGIEQAILRALERDPAARFQTAGELAEALRTAANETCGFGSREQLQQYLRSAVADLVSTSGSTVEPAPGSTPASLSATAAAPAAALASASALAPAPTATAANLSRQRVLVFALAIALAALAVIIWVTAFMRH